MIENINLNSLIFLIHINTIDVYEFMIDTIILGFLYFSYKFHMKTTKLCWKYVNVSLLFT